MSDATLERAAFLALRARPSRETMVAFLRAHQARVFRLCYQVLRNVHDAEDAAQGVLLKIVGEARRFGDPDSLRRWLYRVSLNAAIETARKAARRRDHEVRAAMHKQDPTPLDGATRLALFEALADLDEPSRNLLMEHYFEGEPLQSIADREGCSAPAVCKRMDHARESLRRRLGGAGALAALPSLETLFPAVPPTPDLVTGVVLAEAESAAAVLAAGGIVMASKTTLGISAAVAALLMVAGLVFIAARNSGGSESGKKDGSWPGEVVAGDGDGSSAKAQAPTDSATSGVPVVSEARLRLLQLFGRRYPEWSDKMWRARKGGVYALDLLEDRDVSELAEWIAAQNDPAVIQDLVDIFRTAKSDVGASALVLLAKGRHPELEGFFSDLLDSKEADLMSSRLAAMGLSEIGSPAGLDRLLERLRSTLSDPKGPDYVYMQALGRTGSPGLDRLLGLAESEVAAGRLTLSSLQVQTLHLGFSFDRRIAARLRDLAATHPSPEIRFLATLPLLGSKQGEEVAFAFGRFRDEADPVLREKLSDSIYVRALIGKLDSLPSDLKPELVDLMRQNKNFHPHALLRGGVHWDPERYLPALREAWAGLPEDSRGLLIAELADVNSPDSLRLLEEFALESELTDRTMSPVAMAKSYSDPRLAEKFLSYLQRVTDTSKGIRAAQAVEALAKFPADQRESIASRLEESLPGASRTARLAILSELWRFGPRSEATLLKTARAQGDGVEQLAAWNALSSTDGFASRADLANEAKTFLTRTDPNSFGDPPDKWRPNLASHYLNLLTRSFMAAGTDADIPVLERMAENPRVPFSNHAEIVDLFRRAARTAIDVIRLRSAN